MSEGPFLGPWLIIMFCTMFRSSCSILTFSFLFLLGNPLSSGTVKKYDSGIVMHCLFQNVCRPSRLCTGPVADPLCNLHPRHISCYVSCKRIPRYQFRVVVHNRNGKGRPARFSDFVTTKVFGKYTRAACQ